MFARISNWMKRIAASYGATRRQLVEVWPTVKHLGAVAWRASPGLTLVMLGSMGLQAAISAFSSSRSGASSTA